MHATLREQVILRLLQDQDGFVTFQELNEELDASPATLRRDLDRLEREGRINRVRGGARLPNHDGQVLVSDEEHLAGTPFSQNVRHMPEEKRAIGAAAAKLCSNGTSVMIDGGSTTLQMCRHLSDCNLQVLTNSLHIVRALLPYPDIRILLPGGTLFREQDIILSAIDDDTMPRFHASQFFMGTSRVGAQGVMHSDILVVSSDCRFIERTSELIILVDHTKFSGPSGNVVCGLEDVDIVITDSGVADKDVAMLEAAGVKVIIAPVIK